jgi:putative transferase (TIGR04331 family)
MAAVDGKSGWHIRDRLSDYGFENQIDSLENSSKKFTKRLSECRLCIATYNATTFLETFSNNFPTLLFWNEEHCALNQDAKPYFDKLHHVGILHYSAESLAKKVEEVYQDPIQWWMTDNIQKAKDEFCFQFANIGKSPIRKWHRELKKIASS